MTITVLDTVTVGEQVVSEGLADAFARQLYGDELVDAHLAATGRTAAEALPVDRREVIDTALRRRGR